MLGTVLDRWQPRLVMGIDNCTRALLIDAISFLLMGFLVFSLPPIARHTFNEASPVKQTWLSGFDLLVRTKEIRLLTSLSVLFFFSYGPLEAALPLYSDKILRAGVQGYGLLL
ncbi:MAG: hypothetical protein M3Y76_05380 [Chloroflexota bacterium]|nr:hypothetical protein [Chloroflexota bacterium]